MLTARVRERMVAQSEEARVPGSWFGLSAQANQGFQAVAVVEWIPDLSVKEKSLSCSSTDYHKSLYR